MPDYKEMYLTLFRATEKAVRILTDAQMQAEEIFLAAEDEKADETVAAQDGEW